MHHHTQLLKSILIYSLYFQSHRKRSKGAILASKRSEDAVKSQLSPGEGDSKNVQDFLAGPPGVHQRVYWGCPQEQQLELTSVLGLHRLTE